MGCGGAQLDIIFDVLSKVVTDHRFSTYLIDDLRK